MWSYSQRQQIRENNRKRKVSLHIGLVSYRKECGKMQYEITSQKSILMQARRIAKNPASSVILLLDFFLLSVALHHYPDLFNGMTESQYKFLPKPKANRKIKRN